jgi:hypothetical protein
LLERPTIIDDGKVGPLASTFDHVALSSDVSGLGRGRAGAWMNRLAGWFDDWMAQIALES